MQPDLAGMAARLSFPPLCSGTSAMPDVSPFPCTPRYDVARMKHPLRRSGSPPTTWSTLRLQDQLYKASPYNVIRLESHRDEN